MNNVFSIHCYRSRGSPAATSSKCVSDGAKVLLRVAPAQIVGTPGEGRRGVRRGDARAVCPPNRLSGSSGCEGTTDNPFTGGHHDRRRTQEHHNRRPRQAGGGPSRQLNLSGEVVSVPTVTLPATLAEVVVAVFGRFANSGLIVECGGMAEWSMAVVLKTCPRKSA